MEWFLPFYWSMIRTASTAPFQQPPAQPAPDLDHTGSTDREVVRVLYAILARQVHCARCGATLKPYIEISHTRGPLTRARIVAATSCQGPERHRQQAIVVVERNGDLRFGPLRPR